MPRPLRLWLPVVLSFLVQVPAALAISLHGLADGRVVPSAALLSVGLALVGPLALLAARRAPGPVVAVVAAAASAQLLFDRLPGPPYVALAFAVVLGIVRGAGVWVYSAVGAAWAVSLVLAVALGLDVSPGRVVALTLGVLLFLGLGQGMRARGERIRAMREARERRRVDAAQQERVRIARELHDVLAHSLSQINVQAGVGLHLVERHPEKAAEALASIKQSSKRALDEVRLVLGVLRSEEGGEAPLTPQFGISELPRLVSEVGRDGLRVELEDELAVEPSAAVQSAVYRIVQESLTNVVRHASASRVRVLLRESGADIVVEVADDGTVAGEPEVGRGILGMRERAELLGGTLAAEPRSVSEGQGTAGFRVLARIPREGRP